MNILTDEQIENDKAEAAYRRGFHQAMAYAFDLVEHADYASIDQKQILQVAERAAREFRSSPQTPKLMMQEVVHQSVKKWMETA
jgi:hypothetical protein